MTKLYSLIFLCTFIPSIAMFKDTGKKVQKRVTKFFRGSSSDITPTTTTTSTIDPTTPTTSLDTPPAYTKVITEPYIPDEASSEIVDLLAINSLPVMKYNRVGRRELNNEVAKILNVPPLGITEKQIIDCIEKNPEILSKVEETYPLLLLDECYQDTGGKDCALNRLRYPQRRNQCAMIVAQVLIAKIKESGSVICTSFASGKEFYDTTILTKVCIECPDATILWNSIDFINSPDYAKKHGNIMPLIHNQQTNFFAHTFPKATITFSKYGSALEYIKALQSQTTPPPDIICAIDIVDNKSKDTLPLTWYRLLCSEALNQNPHSVNIQFGTQQINGPIEVVSRFISLNPTETSVEQEVIVPETDTAVTVYETTNIVKVPRK